MQQSKKSEILSENLKQFATHLQHEGRFVFQQDNEHQHEAKALQEWLKNNNPNVLKWLISAKLGIWGWTWKGLFTRDILST